MTRSRSRDLVVPSVNYFYKSNAINKNELQVETGKLLLSEFRKAHGCKITFFWLVQLMRRQGLIVRANREVVLFNGKRIKALLENPDELLPDVKNTIIVNQNKTLSLQNKARKSAESNLQKCYICVLSFTNRNEYHQHMNNKFHQKLNKFLKNVDGDLRLDLLVSDEVVNTDVVPLKKGSLPSLKFRLVNTSSKTCFLAEVEPLNDIVVINDDNIVYPAEIKSNYKIELSAKFNISGDRSIFEVIGYTYNFPNETSLRSSRTLKFIAHDDEFFHQFHATNKWQKVGKGEVREIDFEIIPGPRLPSKTPNRVKLPLYDIPTGLNILINKGFKKFVGMAPNQIRELNKITQLLNVEDHKHCLSEENYGALLTLLLHLEEHQMHINIRAYDTESKELKKLRGNFFQLHVGGLAESRPSILRGDSVFISEINKAVKYEGIVDKIYESSVELGFHPSFHDVFVANKNFAVSFSFCRYPLRVEHQAIRRAENVVKRLFPNPETVTKEFRQVALNLHDKRIANNSQQLQAVNCILQNTSGIYPYLIFGPPGTGKTVTIVETVLQLYNQDKKPNILVCATTNDAVNVVSLKLCNVIGRTEMLRYISYSYSPHNMPEALVKYINVLQGEFYQPTPEQILKYKVVSTTLTNSARIYNMGIKKHFDYIFIDEAAHATETQSLIPVSCLLADNGHIILVGDHKQLGPVVHSPIARDYGFDISMQERLMGLKLYEKDDDGKYNPCYVTKLLSNYRSHPAILEMPNVQFYDGELIPKADDFVNIATGENHLDLQCLKQNFPVIFHHVEGVDEREHPSPSFFNVSEMQVVDKYITSLYKSRLSGRLIEGQDIGVITPYRRQVQKIDKMCTKRGYKNITVGSVEQFQGQEKLVIILSTVRSKSNLLKTDYKFHLGFLSNPKRINVALTRAKALLIVVGNGTLLQLDPYFYEFIKYCKENNALLGESLVMGNPPANHIQANLLNISDDAEEEQEVQSPRAEI